MTTRQLGLVREALTTAGMDISYAYEDLIFLEHNGFLLQFTGQEHELLVHTNSDADEDVLSGAIALLQIRAAELGLTFSMGTRYHLTRDGAVGDQKIRLEFC